MDRRLLGNLGSLYGIHAVSLLLPLLLWTRLGRVLGPALTGCLAIAEAAARYVALVVEFGYQFSATREIAQSQNCQENRSRIVRSVLSGQLILSCAAAAVFLLAMLASPSLRQHGLLASSALFWGVSLGLSPMWYFQGSERMSWAATVDVSCRVIGVALVFALVTGPSDAWLAPAMNGLSSSASALICWRRLRMETPLGRLRLDEGWSGLAAGAHVFLFRGVVSLYTTANILLLGLLVRPESVAFFAAAEKLAKGGISALYPISQAMYPRIARLLETDETKARSAILSSLKAVLALGSLIGLILACCSGWLVSLLFGRAFFPAAPVLVILSGLAPVIAISNVLGLQWMLPQKMERSLNAILAFGAATGLAFALLLAPRFEGAGMAVSILCAESVISGGIVISLMRAMRCPWIPSRIREEMA